MEFDWDENNISHIWQRHHVRPHEAEEAASDPDAEPVEAYEDAGERRESVIGRTVGGRLLFVAFSERQQRWRVITARPANREEQQLYWRRQ